MPSTKLEERRNPEPFSDDEGEEDEEGNESNELSEESGNVRTLLSITFPSHKCSFSFNSLRSKI